MAIDDIKLKAGDAYLSNPNLKRANTPIEWTEDHVIEFLKCKDDPIYFAKNYIKIVHVDEGLVSFDMWPFQEKLISNFHGNRFNIALMPRQVGKCFKSNTKLKLRNKVTGDIIEITVQDFYEHLKKEI